MVVWITGCSTGIGFELAKVFAKAGYSVVATARRKSRLVRLVSEIKFAGYEASAFVCNVQSERSVFSTKKKILERKFDFLNSSLISEINQLYEINDSQVSTVLSDEMFLININED